MLACRSEVIREFYDGSVAIMFRLTQNRFVVGFPLGDDGMLFCGELLTDTNDDDARNVAIQLADYWSEIDTEDEDDPWHGEPEEPDHGDCPNW